MAPELAPRINALAKRTMEVEATVQRLSADAAGDVARLVEGIWAQLRAFEQEHRTLAGEAEQLDDETVKTAMLEKLRLREQMHRQLVVSLRAANLQLRDRVAQQQTLERQQLLSGGTRAAEERQKLTSEALIRTAQSVTETMRRTTGLLHQEVERSKQTVQVLDESSRTLASTRNEHETLRSTVGESQTAVSQLFQRDWVDRLLLGFALAVFALVVLYIVQSRLFPGAFSLWSAARPAGAAP